MLSAGFDVKLSISQLFINKTMHERKDRCNCMYVNNFVSRIYNNNKALVPMSIRIGSIHNRVTRFYAGRQLCIMII